ncbi:MAG: hypothetical protein A2Y15_08605 [Clostridiales bacterium GWF2_36_10]|nr:MAG: hypothetical protein A2Y15_08605 [Clostridiales bacterium GWF2_36_10]HAN20404.1 hypothetical protein [Clostridiales bacterium]
MKWLKTDKAQTIYISIISTLIFTIIIEPAIEIMKHMGNGFFKSLFNYTYIVAAKANDSYFITLIIGGLFYLFFGILSGYVFGSITYKIKNKQVKNTDFGEAKKDRFNTKINNFSKSKITVIILLLLLSLDMFIGYFSQILKNEFDINIITITPYTESHQIDLLKSNWTKMKSKDDYNKIYEVINKIKEINDLN